MPWTPTLTELQDLLADLYDDEAARRRVAAEANLPIERIDFGGASIDDWHSILKAARDYDGLTALIVVVRGEFERNQRIVATLDRIAAQLAAEDARNAPMSPEQKVTPSAAGVAQEAASKPRREAQVGQRVRGGRWGLLAGLAAVIAAIAIIAVVANGTPPMQPTTPVVSSAGEEGGKETVGALVDLPTQGPNATSTTATQAATSTPVPVATFASEAVLLTGDVMTVTSPIEMELVRVPAGEFWMGSDPAKDSLAIENEQPQHRVNLPEYYIGKYEVTNAQYEGFVRATGHAVPSHWENGSIPPEKGNHPVVNVSWNDAIAFADWLSATTGPACRLPTEAEWEKTCRGTEGLIYPWGNSAPDSGQANFYSNVGDTTSVGSYSPKGDSPYGAADIAGNVWEWTSSLYKSYPYNPTDGREDESGSDGLVLRGGSSYDSDELVRCAYRKLNFPDNRYLEFGFRVVCVSPPS